MKVQLIVVQGKPEGKVIPLVGPVFKIGRGETCHLRPNSELVSREHAQFTLHPDKVTVQDLGSRNGTLVNGKALTEVHVLKDRDLVQVGALTFALSIQGSPAVAPAAAAKPASTATKAAPAAATPPPAAAKGAPDDVSFDDIESWLVGDSKNAAPERPSGVYGGDTITITAFGAAAKPAPPEPATDEQYERQQESEEENEEEEQEEAEAEEEENEDAAAETPAEFIDESNPFFAKKKEAESAATAKPVYKDTSDAASDILRRMLERRRAQKSS